MNSAFQDRLRLGVVCALSLAVSLPIAIISVSKLVLVSTFLWLLWVSQDMRRRVTMRPLLAHSLIYLAMAAFSVSVLWSAGSDSAIFKSVVQHGNLLIIPLIYFMIRTRREAVLALQTLMIGQIALLLSSWALYLRFPVPWAQVNLGAPGNEYVVFSSYLDQSIMTAVFCALVWHLQELLGPSHRALKVAAVTALSTVAVFGIFVGRTGYLVAVGLATLGIFWALPRPWRFWAVLTPIVFAGLVGFMAPQALERTQLIGTEAALHTRTEGHQGATTSTGIRINFWKSALLSIASNVWIGHGAGSWGGQFDALQPDSQQPGYVPTIGNPHQEYLLWGVELGIPGVALLVAIFASIWRLSLRFEQQAARATQSVLVATLIACAVNCSLTDALIGDFLCLVLALTLCLGLVPQKPLEPGF